MEEKKKWDCLRDFSKSLDWINWERFEEILEKISDATDDTEHEYIYDQLFKLVTDARDLQAKLDVYVPLLETMGEGVLLSVELDVLHEKKRRERERETNKTKLLALIRTLDSMAQTMGGFICVAIPEEGPGPYGKKIREICQDLNLVDQVLFPSPMSTHLTDPDSSLKDASKDPEGGMGG